jgi:hypothetical protein
MKNIIFVFALVFLSATAFSQKVNFTGEWKLNKEKSELGDQFSLAPQSLKIAHTKKTLDLEKFAEIQGQEFETKEHFTLDGKECVNVGLGESETKSTAAWNKKTKKMIIETAGAMEDGSEYSMAQEISLKEGALVIDMTAGSDFGEMFETYVFDKQ